MKQGAELLKALVSPSVSQDAIAKALGVSQQAVSAWVNGNARPSLERMMKLQELYGVPVEAWTVDSEDQKGAA